MELNNLTIDTPPRAAASIVLVRDGAKGLEILLMRRHTNSDVLGGAYVFPGGKLDKADLNIPTNSRLDTAITNLYVDLGENSLSPAEAAGLYVCAIREALEESGVLFASRHGIRLEADECKFAVNAIRAGTPLGSLLAERDWQLTTKALIPWSRWITPQRPSMLTKRYDTRFFLAVAPDKQQAHQDDYEMTDVRWLTPRSALAEYRDHRIDMIPPQIIGLMHLLDLPDVASAVRDARSRKPPLIEPHIFDQDNERVMCYPGDPEHPIQARALPAPTRLIWRDKRFQPPEGLDALLG